MKEIVVLSGKGGTGKTTISTSLAYLLAPTVAVDCDVNASNMHIMLPHTILSVQSVQLGQKALIHDALCVQCGVCYETCRFRAIQRKHGKFIIDSTLCEGCGVCSLVCTAKAITLESVIGGQWMQSETPIGMLYHAELSPGGENSGKLVSILRKEARETARKKGLEHLICDGPPGIGCPVIASLTDATEVLLVTEPSLAAVHDLKRIIILMNQMGIPGFVCINRWDISPDVTESIERYCIQKHIEPLGRIRYDRGLTECQRMGKSPLEVDTPASEDIHKLGTVFLERIAYGTTIKGNS